MHVNYACEIGMSEPGPFVACCFKMASH